MKKKVLGLLVVGLVVAVVAAVMTYDTLHRREPGGVPLFLASVNIVVAAHDLTIGGKLDQNSIKMTNFARNSIPPGAFTDPGSVMGQYTKTDFVENEPIVADRLTKSPNSAKIPSPVD
jgi:pilus assembly protein CpaB